MSTEQALKEMILERYGTMNAFVEKIGMSPSTIISIFKRGIGNANFSNILHICEELKISANELIRGRIVPVEEVPHEVLEISDLIVERKIREKILTLDGAELNEKEIQLFIFAVEIACHQIRRSREK